MKYNALDAKALLTKTKNVGMSIYSHDPDDQTTNLFPSTVNPISII